MSTVGVHFIRTRERRPRGSGPGTMDLPARQRNQRITRSACNGSAPGLGGMDAPPGPYSPVRPSDRISGVPQTRRRRSVPWRRPRCAVGGCAHPGGGLRRPPGSLAEVHTGDIARAIRGRHSYVAWSYDYFSLLYQRLHNSWSRGPATTPYRPARRASASAGQVATAARSESPASTGCRTRSDHGAGTCRSRTATTDVGTPRPPSADDRAGPPAVSTLLRSALPG